MYLHIHASIIFPLPIQLNTYTAAVLGMLVFRITRTMGHGRHTPGNPHRKSSLLNPRRPGRGLRRSKTIQTKPETKKKKARLPACLLAIPFRSNREPIHPEKRGNSRQTHQSQEALQLLCRGVVRLPPTAAATTPPLLLLLLPGPAPAGGEPPLLH